MLFGLHDLESEKHTLRPGFCTVCLRVNARGVVLFC